MIVITMMMMQRIGNHLTYRIITGVVKLMVLVISYHWSVFIGLDLHSTHQLNVNTHIMVISKS